jgi:CRISPR-associated protein Cmr5
MKLRQSEVAARALVCIEAAAGLPCRAEYRTRANSFATMVAQSGLAQAFGFLLAKRESPGDLGRAYDAYTRDLVAVVGAGWPDLAAQDPDAFYDLVVRADLGQYRRLTRATLDAALWLKRLAQAKLPSESGD